MTRHLYAVLLRPASTFTLPRVGWDFHQAPPEVAARRGLPVCRDYPHGIIATDRPLSPEEVESFDLKALGTIEP